MPAPRMFRRPAGRQASVVAQGKREQNGGEARLPKHAAAAGKSLALSAHGQQHASLTLLIRALARELAREDHARSMDRRPREPGG